MRKFMFFGETWTVDKSAQEVAARSDPEMRCITVSKTADAEDVRNSIMHELIETAMYLSGCRYDCDYPSSRTMYMVDHDRHHIICSQVRAAYDAITT